MEGRKWESGLGPGPLANSLRGVAMPFTGLRRGQEEGGNGQIKPAVLSKTH